jgi:hypothetical protein
MLQILPINCQSCFILCGNLGMNIFNWMQMDMESVFIQYHIGDNIFYKSSSYHFLLNTFLYYFSILIGIGLHVYEI